MIMVTMYTTQFCPFCVRAKMLLDKKGAKYNEIKVDQDYNLRREMTSKSGRNTVPQIWIGEMHVGGCDELFQLENQNKLDQLLKG
ncbi:MAG: glutaredoxin 3 [Saccharospirillaceae bacterium]|nr:glutaredoxin 3 [Pseudomonadales bacterium]NRB79841.1 glutaredoxin 3 [Saccharospirillaceae bacterium]